jgi:NitT/TauT family transport system ATP-binding protein
MNRSSGQALSEGQRPVSPSTVVECRAVSFSYPGDDTGTVEILHDISFSVADTEIVAIVGPSGCGKSTLLHLISGLRVPDSGEVSVLGQPVTGVHGQAAYMMQKDTLLPWLTAVDNIDVAFQAQGQSRLKEARDLLAVVGLEGSGDKYPHQLSGGMRKRVQLARMLAQDANIFLMDEPFGALDVQTRLVLQEELLRLCEAHRKTVVFVTHDVGEACFLGDRVLVLDKFPATVRYSHDIKAERPRDFHALINTPDFARVQQDIWEQLREFHSITR